MCGSHDRKVATVECGQGLDVQALGDGDDRGVHRPERQIAVARDQLSDPQPIARAHRLRCEYPTREIAQEPDLSFWA